MFVKATFLRKTACWTSGLTLGLEEVQAPVLRSSSLEMIPGQVFEELRCVGGRQGLPGSHTSMEFRGVAESLWCDVLVLNGPVCF